MKDKLATYFNAGYSGLYIHSFEEQRALEEISGAASDCGFSVWVWSMSEGMSQVHPEVNKIADTESPIEALKQFNAHTVGTNGEIQGTLVKNKAVLVMLDVHEIMRDYGHPPTNRIMKDTIAIGKKSNRVLVILGAETCVPKVLEKELTLVEFKLPSKPELAVTLDNIAESAGVDIEDRDGVLDAAAGMTTIEAENAFALSVVQDKKILAPPVYQEKVASLKKGGVIEVIETDVKVEDIGGMDLLKRWFVRRRNAYSKAAQEYGLPVAKGVLLVGPPGVGKSLSAKAVAGILERPLLRLDGGKIFASHIGESERNMRSAIQVAEAIAPCVLWIDEIEKAFSGSKSSSSTDGGTSARVFGTFLTWMQEKTAPVFVVSTANDVTQLPPEFLRKGRFDEMFFIDLPNDDERGEIWKIQIAKWKRKPKDYDIAPLVNATPMWTGAEIEGLFSDSLFTAFEEGREPTTKLLTELAEHVSPLAKVMGVEIESLRKWADGRAMKATSPTTRKARQGRKVVSSPADN
jgi:ATP-dependent 26S proteasome regulatory subunit